MLSRRDTAIITCGRWLQRVEDPSIYWWTIQTDKTGTEDFRIIGRGKSSIGELALDDSWLEEKRMPGMTVKIGDLVAMPRVDGLYAFNRNPEGVVLASIGRVYDGLEPLCGKLGYIVYKVRTRSDNVEPSRQQKEVLQKAHEMFVMKGKSEAQAFLESTNLFRDVFEFYEAAVHTNLDEETIEWHE
jgi:hypothetical protein